MIQDLRRFLEEDLGFLDLTSDLLIPKGLKARGVIVVKEEGIIAGLEEAEAIFKSLGLEVNLLKKDGDLAKPGEVVLEVRGDARKILMAERTVLNLMMRMSGIATETRKCVEKLKKSGLNVRIAATRKTAPGLRFFDKKAVMLGGGDPHRFRLDDAVLIKDNHVRLVGSVREAIRRIRERLSFVKKLEVEVRSVEEAIEAAEEGADILLLDNMSVEEVKETIKALKSRNLYDKVLLEASGRINFSNLLDYASTGVHILSLGYLTHSVKALDMSLEIVEILSS